MNSSDSSDDSNSSSNFQYWNEWQKPDDLTNFNANVKRKQSFPFKALKNNNNLRQRKKIQNWIPPAFIDKPEKLRKLNSKSVVSDKEQNNMDIFESTKDSFNVEESLDQASVSIKPSPCTVLEVEKLLNANWGKRIELHDVMEYIDDNVIWGVVNLGVFDVINIWINEYGNICGLAEGTISKVGFSETTKISITNIHLLQKMLSLSHPQWTSLCDRVHQKRENLRFKAQNTVDLEKMTSLEKLWYFICRRRHFLPDQCMLLKFNGVIKSLKEFKIIPKFIVQDIKNIQDRESLN